MNKHFIKNIEIRDFKCFENFKAEGFGRVNLIGGKNNVGKTALMEACYINVYSHDTKTMLQALHGIKYMRENLNILFKNIKYDPRIFLENSNHIFTKSNILQSNFEIEDQAGEKNYIFEFDNKKTKVNANLFSMQSNTRSNILFIDNFGLSNSHIISNYAAVQKKDQESSLNNFLHNFDSQIEAFKIIDEKPQCKIHNTYLELTEMGDGTSHLVSIITSLYTAENGYIFIDEIDNGIHYTQLDEIWKIILNISKELNIQVFATTHSKECIESYAKVAKKLEDQETTYIKMTRLDNGDIMAGIRDYAMLQDSMNDGHEVRGW